MHVTVDAARCQGRALCAAAIPDVFDLSDDDGHSSVPDPKVPEHLQEDVRMTAANCPEHAIVISG
jgi:ferredoxin